jgi:hypothetical protein
MVVVRFHSPAGHAKTPTVCETPENHACEGGINTSQPSPNSAIRITPYTAEAEETRLEGDGGTTLLLVTAELEVLASLEGELVLRLARGALEAEDDFLGLLGERWQGVEIGGRTGFRGD